MPIDVGTNTAVQWIRGTAATGHTVTLAVTKPDGTVLDPAPVVTESPAASGTYTATVPGTFAGRYLLTWTDTTATATLTDTLEVWPADPRFLISFDDAVHALQWQDRPAELTKNGSSLRLYIAATTEVIEDIVGAVLIRTIVQPADGGRTGVPLWERPSKITSVAVGGTAWPAYVPNLNAGIVYADGHNGRFPGGRQNVVVTYETGAEQVGPSVQLAARELVRHLWQIGQQVDGGDSAAYNSQGVPMGRTPSGFAVPNRVIELCSNQYRLPGIA